MSKKFLVGGIVGGIAFFLLGYLVFGTLLADFFKSHSNSTTGAFRADTDIVWWSMVVGNLAYGFLFSYVIGKAGAHSVAGGFKTGAITALLVYIAMNCIQYALMNLSDTTLLAVDIAAGTVVGGIVGAVIGWVQSKV
jgi:hypothetical protein